MAGVLGALTLNAQHHVEMGLKQERESATIRPPLEEVKIASEKMGKPKNVLMIIAQVCTK